MTASGALVRAGLDRVSVNALVIDGRMRLLAAADGVNTGLGIVTPAGVFRADSDTTWAQAGLANALITDLIRTPQGTLLAGTEGIWNDVGTRVGRGLARSTDDGRTWTVAGPGIPHAETYALAAGDGLLCAAADVSVFCSDDRGDAWRLVYTQPDEETQQFPSFPYEAPFYPRLVFHPAGDLFVWTGAGRLLRSSDRGATWTVLPVDVPLVSSFRYVGGLQASYRHRLVVSASGTLLIGDDAGLWRSTDRGETWMQVFPGASGVPVVAVAAAPGGRLFALTSTPTEVTVFTSDDEGQHWTPRVGLPPLTFPLLVATHADDVLYVMGDEAPGDYNPRLFQLKEDGSEWTLAQPVEGVPRPTDLVVDAEGRLYVATGDLFQGDTIFRSADEGRTWHALTDDGLVDGAHRAALALALAIDADGYLYAGTAFNGVFRSHLSDFTTVAAEPGLDGPARLTLAASYPNPFRAETTIGFTLAQPARVTLGVYDLLGRRVALLIGADRLPPGRHDVRWHAAGHPSGVYVYKLIVDGAVKAGRMVLLK